MRNPLFLELTCEILCLPNHMLFRTSMILNNPRLWHVNHQKQISYSIRQTYLQSGYLGTITTSSNARLENSKRTLHYVIYHHKRFTRRFAWVIRNLNTNWKSKVHHTNLSELWKHNHHYSLIRCVTRKSCNSVPIRLLAIVNFTPFTHLKQLNRLGYRSYVQSDDPD